jgi:hypothetical protein
MRISSIPPTPPFQGSPKDPVVKEFNDLWDAWWYADPSSKKEANQLLDFLEKPQNKAYLKNIADNYPAGYPKPKLAFDAVYLSAINTLSKWIDRGGTKDVPSEFITDIAQWVNYTQ